MDIDKFLVSFYVFSLAAFLGYQVISKVPQLLHTPLMAFTNAISGISLVASILIFFAVSFVTRRTAPATLDASVRSPCSESDA